MSRPQALCSCGGKTMQQLNVASLNRFYVCPECGTIREEVCRSDGVIAYVRFHDAQSDELPAIVRQQARAILDRLTHRQLSLFET